MTEGGIAEWKKKEGESFTAGDVLLEIVRSLSSYDDYDSRVIAHIGDRQGNY